MRPLALPAAFFILTVLSSVSASAQAGFTLKGTVVDTTGAPIVGARVSIDADAKAPSETLVSDHSGVFAVTFRPGRHHVTTLFRGI